MNLEAEQENQTMLYKVRKKNRIKVAFLGFSFGSIAFVSAPVVGFGQTFVSGSTGEDGSFNPSCTPTPCTVNVQLPPSGIFNYTTVNIPDGVTVTYTRNPANTPVTILATGDVTIAGTIDVSGANASASAPGRGGPGGFDGGLGGTPAHIKGTAGLGPGGGPGGDPALGGTCAGCAGHAGYAAAGFGPEGVGGGPAYGVHTIFPLIGGSGGGGGAGGTLSDGPGGSGGGGAILIASSGTIDTTGSVGNFLNARGGFNTGTTVSPNINVVMSGCGSGGAIRLISNVYVRGSRDWDARSGCFVQTGADGRVRLEYFQGPASNNLGQLPVPSLGTPGQIPVLPGANFPSVKITAIGGTPVPPNPQAAFLAAPDTTLDPNTPNPITVNLQASNVPLGTVIAVSAVTEGFTTPVIVNSTALAGTLASSTATANVTLPSGVSVLTATALFAAAP